MRSVVRWFAVAVSMVHGLVHLIGAAEGFGWAEVAALAQPIDAATGAGWLAAGLLVMAAAVMLAVETRGWWIAAGIAALSSQVVILTSWSDAAAGSLANVLLLVAAGYGWASRGPSSHRAVFRRHVAAALASPQPPDVVTEADLAGLPEPVARYVRGAGAVGQPRITNLHARMHGRIRADAGKPWMTFTAEQVSTFVPETSRLFLMDATMLGLPVDVLHTFVGDAASMRVKVCSVVPMVDASGPDLARAETVTLFNDLCILAPAALVDAPVTWQPIDDRRVRATYRDRGHSVTAELVFNERNELVDFVSDDRLAASADGRSFTRRRWSTPLRAYRQVGARRVAVEGEACWHPPASGAAFTYLELRLDDIRYNVGTSRLATERGRPLPAGSR